ncbi:MAG: glycogen debranching protein, partial [Nocardioidaceae bacterium]|nr:glycogen debranching protein [Nocardioidaceae bacterium]
MRALRSSVGITATILIAGALATPGVAAPSSSGARSVAAFAGVKAADLAATRLPRSPELTTTTRLDDRRAVVIGHRFYSTWTEDGLYPAMGFHTRGEMGGFWTPPIKLLDGIWFRVDGEWLGDGIAARKFASGWGYTRTEYAARNGLTVHRTDVIPDGPRAGLIGLTFRSESDQRVPLAMDAHSELMLSYPWGETTPSQLTVNKQDSGSVAGKTLVFRERAGASSPVGAHDWAAVVGSSLTPTSISLGPNHRGPQDPAVICPASGPESDPAPPRCDDTAYGKGTGGQLRYHLRVPADHPVTVWFAVAGSDRGPAMARTTYQNVVNRGGALLQRKINARSQVNRRSAVSLPGDRLLQRSLTWSKQNLADSVQESRRLRLRWVDRGESYPPVEGRLARARWLGAGWPDYPWMFGTDGEYTAFASVAMG